MRRRTRRDAATGRSHSRSALVGAGLPRPAPGAVVRPLPNSTLPGWYLAGVLPARVVACGVEAHEPVNGFVPHKPVVFGSRRYVDPEFADQKHG